MQPLYGFIQDKLGLKKTLLRVIGFLLLISGPYFIFVCTPLLQVHIIPGAISIGLYVGATFFAGIGALECYTERVSRIVGFEYGRARMWGSLGWAGATLLAGLLFNINPQLNFWMGSVSALIFIILLWWMKDVQTNALNELEYGKTSALSLSDALSLLKLPASGHWWYLSVASVYITFTINNFPSISPHCLATLIRVMKCSVS